MAKKVSINERCPLQGSCEKKSCEYIKNELECSYYAANSFGDNVIPDQEAIREERNRKFEDENFDEYDDFDDKSAAIVMLPIDQLFPHPDNPRKDLGDLSELADSIKAKGILQNLTVVPKNGGYTIVIGHRRCAAAKIAGLTELPCALVNMTYAEQIQTMMLENMQRTDLTIYEQAQGFQMMLDLGDDMNTIAEKTGFSKSTIRRRVNLMALDQDKLKEASERQLTLTDLDKLSEIEDVDERNKLLDVIGTNNFAYKVNAAIDRQKNKAKEAELRQALNERGLLEMSAVDRYSGKYIYRLNISSIGEKTLDVLKPDIQHYYYLNYGCAYIYAPIENKVVESDAESEEKARKQAEKDARITALKEANARAHQLRKDFLMNVSNTTAKKHIRDIVNFAVRRQFEHGIYAPYSKAEFYDYSGITADKATPEAIQEFVDSKPELALLYHTYAMWDDNGQTTFFYWNGTYSKNHKLECCYEFLTAMGYEMSDEEKTMRDGTSELFERDDQDDDDDEYDDDEDV